MLENAGYMINAISCLFGFQNCIVVIKLFKPTDFFTLEHSHKIILACYLQSAPMLEPYSQYSCSCGGDLGARLFSKMRTVCLVCTSMVINASRCQPCRTAWKHSPHTSLSASLSLYAQTQRAIPSDAPLYTLM